MWADLAKHHIPELVKSFPESIRVWSAGCAGGEEAYSFRILWHHLEKEIKPLPALEILATDSNPECIQRALKGIFQSSSLHEVQENSLSLFFSKHRRGKQYQISSDLISSITFKHQDLLHDPPEGVFHLIFLRNNLLTYHRFPFIQSSFQRILNCLTPGGLLIIGAHEKLPIQAGPMQSCGPMVWKKVTANERKR
jgi:chemotaxis protein methyltransferase CheR